MEGEPPKVEPFRYIHGTESMPSMSQQNDQLSGTKVDHDTLGSSEYSLKPSSLLPHSSDPVIPILDSSSVEQRLPSTPPIVVCLHVAKGQTTIFSWLRKLAHSQIYVVLIRL